MKNSTKSEDIKAKVKESWKCLMVWLHFRTDRQEPRRENWIHLSGEGQGERDKWAWCKFEFYKYEGTVDKIEMIFS